MQCINGAWGNMHGAYPEPGIGHYLECSCTGAHVLDLHVQRLWNANGHGPGIQDLLLDLQVALWELTLESCNFNTVKKYTMPDANGLKTSSLLTALLPGSPDTVAETLAHNDISRELVVQLTISKTFLGCSPPVRFTTKCASWTPCTDPSRGGAQRTAISALERGPTVPCSGVSV